MIDEWIALFSPVEVGIRKHKPTYEVQSELAL